VHLNDAAIPWGPLSDFCPEIPDGFLISSSEPSSDRVKQATQNVGPDGTMRVVVNDLVTGSASDNFGGDYTFVYQNHVSLDFDGATVHVHMKDTFRLNGDDVSYTVGFNWKWAYAADSLDVFEIVDGNGQTVDVAIDPFLFPTEDGDTESPAIISGSWQRLSTQGEPWKCDPL
jgi:hypothetical protein